jgi:hypothetical protein
MTYYHRSHLKMISPLESHGTSVYRSVTRNLLPAHVIIHSKQFIVFSAIEYICNAYHNVSMCYSSLESQGDKLLWLRARKLLRRSHPIIINPGRQGVAVFRSCFSFKFTKEALQQLEFTIIVALVTEI